MAEIELDDVTKRYADGFEAVKHFNLDVHDGELMVLVGPPGSGKSTVLRMVARLSDGTKAQKGQPLELWFDPQRLQLFDPETGRSLLATEPSQTTSAAMRAAA